MQKNIDDVHLLESKQRTLKDSGNPKDPSEPSIAFLKSSGFNLNKEVKKSLKKTLDIKNSGDNIITTALTTLE